MSCLRRFFFSHLFKRSPCLGFPVIKAGDHGEEKHVAVDDISCEDKRGITPFDTVFHGDFNELAGVRRKAFIECCPYIRYEKWNHDNRWYLDYGMFKNDIPYSKETYVEFDI